VDLSVKAVNGVVVNGEQQDLGQERQDHPGAEAAFGLHPVQGVFDDLGFWLFNTNWTWLGLRNHKSWFPRWLENVFCV
jgi:hypothetical protein